jgi:cold shock CspA family protein/ribosome-associated translation inhibitor RaiA
MDRPLDIAFHNLDSSPTLEGEIRQRVAKLEARFGKLIGCRVSVEKLHNQHRTGNVFDVHIVMSVPGRDLVVSREPNKMREKYANPDVRTSVRDAFEAAERQLQEFKGKLREDTATPTAHALAGQVTQLPVGADHGFILTNTGTQLYFHRDSVTDGRFEDLKVGDLVHYVEAEGDTGPTASKVRVGSGSRTG